MKNVNMFALFVVTLIWSSSTKAKAQDMIFSSFACTPSTCLEETPIPVFQGTALVTYAATCTGGVISGMSGRAKAVVGDIGQCLTPYTPHAEIDRYRTTFVDDCQRQFHVDTAKEIAEIFHFGSIVWLDEAEVSCDGGTSGPTGAGSKPC